jgi:hypothetical protein
MYKQNLPLPLLGFRLFVPVAERGWWDLRSRKSLLKSRVNTSDICFKNHPELLTEEGISLKGQKLQ